MKGVFFRPVYIKKKKKDESMCASMILIIQGPILPSLQEQDSIEFYWQSFSPTQGLQDQAFNLTRDICAK